MGDKVKMIPNCKQCNFEPLNPYTRVKTYLNVFMHVQVKGIKIVLFVLIDANLVLYGFCITVRVSRIIFGSIWWTAAQKACFTHISPFLDRVRSQPVYKWKLFKTADQRKYKKKMCFCLWSKFIPDPLLPSVTSESGLIGPQHGADSYVTKTALISRRSLLMSPNQKPKAIKPVLFKQ